MELRKQAIGIDISKDTFTACLASQPEHGEIQLSPVEVFINTKSGFNRLLRWAKPMVDTMVPLVFLMESTGVYYQNLAHHLHGVGKTVHVVLPNKSSHYGKSLNIKTKTDATDARVLARFGVERDHRAWEPPSPLLAELRNLTRYYVQLQEQKTTINNMVHSKQAAHNVQAFILASNKQLVRQIDRQIERCKQQIEKLIASDSLLSDRVDQLASIKGVGRLTVAVILAETRMFEGICNTRQLASYAGYDVTERESGTSVKGKTRISKKGNRYIRNALYFPAMVACRFNPDLKEFYGRVIRNKPSKMIGQVAVQRKLLLLMYSLHKNGTRYQEGYNKVAPTPKAEATLDSIA
ncbi:MAG: IS110 family transposase [Balneola sp.]|nr:IS110 family transposase [Balneola sp.]|tara:strand:+ start:259 stop:1311 length:1053 start_codon:yes stop_codon:yes gene_type:complete